MSIHTSPNSAVYTGFRGWGYREQCGGVLFNIREIKNLPFFKLENFQKMIKKLMKNYSFWKVFKEILRVFENL